MYLLGCIISNFLLEYVVFLMKYVVAAECRALSAPPAAVASAESPAARAGRRRHRPPGIHEKLSHALAPWHSI